MHIFLVKTNFKEYKTFILEKMYKSYRKIENWIRNLGKASRAMVFQLLGIGE